MPKPYIILNRSLNNYNFTRARVSNKPKKDLYSRSTKKFKKTGLLFPLKNTVNVVFVRKLSNMFLTIVNGRGDVVISKSAGNCKIVSKKKRNLETPLKLLHKQPLRICKFLISELSKIFT